MILITSSNDDISTNYVIDWIAFYNKKFIRINNTDIAKLIYIKLSNNKFNFRLCYKLQNNVYVLDLNNITSYWYRRGKLRIYFKKESNLDNWLIKYLEHEIKFIYQFINYIFRKIKHIGSYDDNKINKLTTLIIANEVGFKIPETLITQSKEELNKFIQLKESITKAICNGSYIDFDNLNIVGFGTKLIENTPINYDTLFFNLIQNNIDKKYEIRVFFLNDKVWATAIFSQNDIKTKIDFRNYNRENPNRCVPYNLPLNIHLKIIKLMNRLKLNSGSLDIIVDVNKEYIFLEVNPVGQFQQVSIPNNYQIEKEIAKSLI